ncbi:MAG: HAMP domain-containing histidine kinase [Phormidesmis sp. FL-bin-119]|nr:HAMP domain-containing histidine kinase [Pedobacter sp.]
MKFVPKIIILTTFVTLLFISAVLVFKSDHYEKQQASNWVDSLRKSVLPQLIESDYIPLLSKIDLVKKTGIFDQMGVYNRKGVLIASFGQTNETSCSPSEEKIIADDAGSMWGKICYRIAPYSTIRIFALPFVLIALILLIMSAILSKSISVLIESENKKRKIEAEKSTLIQSIASQVAHDIRSPLAALEMIMSIVQKQVDIGEREIMRNALNRIKDIANNLISKPGGFSVSGATSFDIKEVFTTSELIVPLIESVVSETRAQYMNFSKIKIECEISEAARTAFVETDRVEFKRVISNILNNSIESQNREYLNVILRISVNENRLQISIVDDGKGMPEEVLQQLGNPGVSFGKENNTNSGNGLGISHALKSVKAWGGEITFYSKVNEGTVCSISLSLAKPAGWFPVSIEIDKETLIVICDDDLAIHSIWQNRFREFNTRHMNSLKELRTFYQENFADLDKVLYLVDHTFIDESQTGLELIIELGLECAPNKSRSILVTSYYEDDAIRSACIRNGFYLLPKTMSGFIPIIDTTAML